MAEPAIFKVETCRIWPETARHGCCSPLGMLGAKRVEELDVYKLAVALRREVFKVTAKAPAKYDYKFVGQIRDAARGGPRNIAEGFSRCIPTEFCRFLSYAKASVDETRDEILDGSESAYFSEEESQQLLSLVRRTLAAISGLMRYLESPAAMRAYKAILRARLAAANASRKCQSRRRRTLEP
jgi:four helix bundle protein